MKKILIVFCCLFTVNSNANYFCLSGTDLAGNKILDCSTSGGGFYRELDKGSNKYRNDYGVGNWETQQEIETKYLNDEIRSSISIE